jgi:hypothetical protein
MLDLLIPRDRADGYASTPDGNCSFRFDAERGVIWLKPFSHTKWTLHLIVELVFMGDRFFCGIEDASGSCDEPVLPPDADTRFPKVAWIPQPHEPLSADDEGW